MTRISSLRPLVFAGLAVAGSQFAQAASVSTLASFSMSDSLTYSNNTSSAYDSLGASDYVTLARFDSSLGTLNAVTLEYFNVYQTSGASASFKDDDWLSETSGLVRLQNMGITSSFLGFNYTRSRANRSATCSDTGGAFSGAVCSASLGSSGIYLGSASYTITNASTLALLTGSGTIGTTLYQNGNLYTDETDGDDGYVNSRYGSLSTSGYLRLTYNYTAPAVVPVPAAAWLMGSALLGLVGIGRSRRSGVR